MSSDNKHAELLHTLDGFVTIEGDVCGDVRLPVRALPKLIKMLAEALERSETKCVNSPKYKYLGCEGKAEYCRYCATGCKNP